jgi:hypothetical protein
VSVRSGLPSDNLLEQGELHNLLDLEAEGGSDYGVGLDIPWDLV